MSSCRLLIFIAVVLPVCLAGCRGDRITTFIEEPTDDGRWRVDGTLIRSYNVTLEQAREAILKHAHTRRWIVFSDTSDKYTADIDVRTLERVEINFDVWAPQGKATDIGIEYADGDKIGSTRVFDDLERVLPGKRITVNQ